MELSFFSNILIIAGLSAAVLYLCHLLKVPVIIGFLITGIIAGPQALKLISDLESVQSLAEIGIILLLFTIGIEFSFQNLFQFKRPALVGGSIQIALTGLVIFLISVYAGLPLAEAILVGFIVSLSSTAIVMKLLQERAEVDTPHGNTVLGILIFQDIMVVPMMLLVPILAGIGNVAEKQFSPAQLLQIVAVLLLIAGARWAVPWVLFKVTRTRSRELFFLGLILICLGIAWLTHRLGLSLALGAFLAGLIISESEYSHEALSHLLPFRDVFMSFFFISIGMLLDIGYFFSRPFLLVFLAAAVIALKVIFAAIASGVVGLPIRNVIIAGFCLGQIGEFSFILSASGLSAGLMPRDHYQAFIAVSVLTMIATPFMMIGAPRLAGLTSRLRFLGALDRDILHHSRKNGRTEKNHLIIVGFGLNGRNLARAARKGGIPYVIIEMNPTVIREERAKGEPIFYGDATKEKILEHANIAEARSIVVVINDPAAAARIVWLARRLNSGIYIIVRTRFIREIDNFSDLGANEVIPEEFETSVEIFTRVLRNYLLPKDEIENLISEIRAEEYDMLRSVDPEALTCSDFRACLPELHLTSVRLPEGSPLLGNSLAGSGIREEFGLTLMALVRGSENITNPPPDIIFHQGDVLVVAGHTGETARFEKHVRGKSKTTAQL
ncbi:MAG: cation:proton antiporter [Syntrophaceae bacterium]